MTKSNQTLSRRNFIKGSIGLTSAAVVPNIVGCSDMPLPRELSFSALKSAKQELQKIVAADAVQGSAKWSLAKTLVHCAQSIEYSLTGYPVNYSPVFHNTVGKAARSLFLWQGYMRHDIEEEIPGADKIEEKINLKDASIRLEFAIDEFIIYSGRLQPHFAYGRVERDDYARLHAMHIANHFSAFTF